MKLLNRSPKFCAICQKELKHKHKPKKEWNIEGLLCADCHMDKMRQYFEGTMTHLLQISIVILLFLLEWDIQEIFLLHFLQME